LADLLRVVGFRRHIQDLEEQPMDDLLAGVCFNMLVYACKMVARLLDKQTMAQLAPGNKLEGQRKKVSHQIDDAGLERFIEQLEPPQRRRLADKLELDSDEPEPVHQALCWLILHTFLFDTNSRVLLDLCRAKCPGAAVSDRTSKGRLVELLLNPPVEEDVAEEEATPPLNLKYECRTLIIKHEGCHRLAEIDAAVEPDPSGKTLPVTFALDPDVTHWVQESDILDEDKAELEMAEMRSLTGLGQLPVDSEYNGVYNDAHKLLWHEDRSMEVGAQEWDNEHAEKVIRALTFGAVNTSHMFRAIKRHIEDIELQQQGLTKRQRTLRPIHPPYSLMPRPHISHTPTPTPTRSPPTTPPVSSRYNY